MHTEQAYRTVGAHGFTLWTNPTNHVIKVRIFRHPKIVRRGAPPDPGFDIIEWQPGETVQLPSSLDETIQVIRNGIVVSGRAPQLVKNGERVPLHPSLDPNETAKREAEKAAAQALAAKQVADSALLVAHGTIAAAEAVEAQQTKKGKKAEKAADQS
jgi:hypothetical protein